MAETDFRRLGELFAAALERPPAQRDAFVATHCTDDAVLAAELRALLAHEDAANNYFEKLGQKLQQGRPGEMTQGLLAQRRLGAYHLDRHLGSGGMGSVFLAHRADG